MWVYGRVALGVGVCVFTVGVFTVGMLSVEGRINVKEMTWY